MSPLARISRRRFLALSSTAAGGTLVFPNGCATRSAAGLTGRFEFEQRQMGVPFRLVLYAASAAQAETAAQAAMTRIAGLNSLLSDYEEDSELNRLTRTAGTGQRVPVSAELWTVLQRAQQMARLSGGAFDVTAGPYISLWRRARRIHRFPEPEKLAEARRAVGYEKLRLHPGQRAAELLAPRMRLDLGGIAKGYAADEALRVLRGHGIRSALVAASGDVAVSQPPPDAPHWRVEVAPHPDAVEPVTRRLKLQHRALATSGDAFQAVMLEGKRYSHIVDPRTGLGLTDQSQVTVVARDGMTADALSTTVSVLGPECGLPLIESLGAAALIQRHTPDGIEALTSRRFTGYLL